MGKVGTSDKRSILMSSKTEKIDLVITHVFDTPVEQVWNAWIDPEVVMQWWGPDHFTCPLAKIDFRVGGTSLLCMRAPQEFGGQDSYNTAEYTNIVPMQQIDFLQNLTDANGTKLDTSTMGFPSEFPQELHTQLSFKALGNGKTELTVTEYAWPEGQMLEMSRMGMEQCLAKMAATFVQA